jgi:hypothetical protein
MAIRNGSATAGDYEVQQPMPLGQYLASTAMTVTSIVLVVAGATLEIVALMIEAGTALSIAAILAVLAGAVVEGINLSQGSSRAGVTEGQVGVLVSVTERIQIGEAGSGSDVHKWPVSPNTSSRVVFFERGTNKELAASVLTTQEEMRVELVEHPSLVEGGSPTYSVTVAPGP